MFKSLKAKIIGGISLFSFSIIFITYSILYFINSKNSVDFSKEKLNTEMAVSLSYLKETGSYSKILNTLINSDENIVKIRYIEGTLVSELKGKAFNDNVLFEETFKINENIIIIFYSENQKMHI